jgi:hypothetical protein
VWVGVIGVRVAVGVNVVDAVVVGVTEAVQVGVTVGIAARSRAIVTMTKPAQ